MPASGTYFVEAVRVLDTDRTPIQKQPEALLCLVGISRRYYLGDDVYSTFHYDDDREIDLFSLIRAPNPTKVKTGSRPRAPHELPLLTFTASCVIEIDEPAASTDSSGVPSAIERSPLDFTDEAEASGRETAAPEMPPPEEVPITTIPGGNQAAKTVAVEPPAVRQSRKRGHEGIDANAPPKSLRRDHADLRPSSSSRGGKSLAAMQLCLASNIFMYEGVPADVSDPDPLAFADAPSPHPADVAQSSQGVAVIGDPESENVYSPTEVGSLGSVYRPEWGVTNGSLLDTPEACQDLVDHVVPPGYFTELRHMPNEEFLRQYNVNLARQHPGTYPSLHTAALPSGLAAAYNPQRWLSGFPPQTPAAVKHQPAETSAYCSPEVPRTEHAFFPILDSAQHSSLQRPSLYPPLSPATLP
nr:transposase (putative), gypsy type [Tanacetum cinerariifolium]